MRKVGEIRVELFEAELPPAPPGKLTPEQVQASNAERARIDEEQRALTHHTLQHLVAAAQHEAPNARIKVTDNWRGRRREA